MVAKNYPLGTKLYFYAFRLSVRVYSDNARRTSKRGKYSPTARSVLLCSHHVLTSSVRYLSTHALTNGLC